METSRAEDIRSVAVVGHKGAGKTALIEAMAYLTRAVSRLGKPGERGLGLDDTPEEEAHQATCETRLVTLSWGGARLHLLDTPGESGFWADTRLAFEAADAVLLVVSARAGIEPGTRRLASLVQELKKPCMVAITRCDDDQARVEEVVGALRDLKEPVAIVEVPHHRAQGAALDGVVSVATMKAFIGHRESPDQLDPDPIPEDVKDEVRRTRERLVDDVAGTDDTLAEHYLTDGDLDPAELLVGERRAVASGKLVPVLFTSATVPFGIVALLDALVDFAPTARDLPPRAGTSDGRDVTREPRSDAPLCALVVKTKIDAHGRTSLVRVVSGTLRSDGHVLCVGSGEKERIGQLLRGAGKEQKPLTEACAGELVIVPKLKRARTGETLTDDKHPIVLEGPVLPVPIFSRAVITPQKSVDEKIAQALRVLEEEDPGLRVALGADGHQLVVSGLGALHLDITLERLRRRTKVDVKLGPPRVAYCETITRPVKGVEGKQKKQTGGHGQFGVAILDVEPLPRGAGFVFEDAVVGGTVPRQFIGSVQKGVERALARGVVAGYPVVDVKVRLVDGKHHSVDSSDAAFQTAGYKGFLAAARAARPVLLEPLAKLSLTVPAQALGDVLGDVAARNGSVLGHDVSGEFAQIAAYLPFAQMSDYEPVLSARTQGRGSFVFSFDHYELVPPAAQAKIVRDSGFQAEDED
jgi:elongation factor G